MAKYKYGMKLRGFSLGCQPLGSLDSVEDDPTGRYYDILTYTKRLEPEVMDKYDLVMIGVEPEEMR